MNNKNKLIILVAIIIGSLYFINIFNNQLWQKTGKTLSISIPQGASTAQIASILREKNIIKSSFAFKLLSRINGNDGKYESGYVVLHSDMPYTDIFNRLKNAKSKNSFTVPEGYTIAQIADLLTQKGLIKRETFYKLIETGRFDYSFINDQLPSGKNRLEGYLFPDTYTLGVNIDEYEIIDMMLKRFSQVYKKDYSDRASQLGLSTHKAITLASIIEREASTQLDLVSSVFHNRLDGGYKYLESCATVQYILNKRKDVLSVEDTRINSPYNTYINPGLPPGPIASPGERAIKAALFPAKTDYLYFAAKPDGTHYFSKTYNEHLKVAPK